MSASSTLSRTFSIISAGVCGLSATDGEPPIWFGFGLGLGLGLGLGSGLGLALTPNLADVVERAVQVHVGLHVRDDHAGLAWLGLGLGLATLTLTRTRTLTLTLTLTPTLTLTLTPGLPLGPLVDSTYLVRG